MKGINHLANKAIYDCVLKTTKTLDTQNISAETKTHPLPGT